MSINSEVSQSSTAETANHEELISRVTAKDYTAGSEARAWPPKVRAAYLKSKSTSGPRKMRKLQD